MTGDQILAAISQTIGGGSAGALQAGSAFTAEISSLQSKIDAKAASLGSVLGAFGLSSALKSASGSASASSSAQEASLIASLKAQWIYLIPIVLIVGWLYLRRKL